MARRRTKKRNSNDAFIDFVGQLILLVAFIIGIVLKLIFRLIIFIYDLITYYTSKYKDKSDVGFIKMYFDKGNYGEFVLYRKVARVFGRESVLTNLYLDNMNTETTEIDVLAVTSKGIYVFEMKNYSGYIFGSEKDKHWTQVLNKWTKNKFYNPLRQNYAHTKAVESYLDIDKNYIIPVIVFSNRSKLSKINVGLTHNVFQYRKAIKFIKNIEKKNQSIIEDKNKEQYLIKLLDKCHMPEEVRIKHIQQVKALQELDIVKKTQDKRK